ncbi:MAG: lectin-like protein, partial [Roseibacillus sp.]|nr:lectin-like protein [Roseibacillus sp.]
RHHPGWGDFFYNGSLDDVRVYSRALSEEEVSDLYDLEKPEETNWTDSSFEIVEGSFTWEEAKADAESRGGRLAVLDTQARINMAEAFLGRFSERPDTWIGLTDSESEGDWRWTTGQPLAASAWLQGEPNNADAGGENHAVIQGTLQPVDFAWNDINSRNLRAYLLEIPSLSLEDGLVAYYPFNGNANDESGNHNNGTVNGATLTTDRNGDVDSAYDFENSNISIENPLLPQGDSPRTLSFWARTNDPSKIQVAVQWGLLGENRGTGAFILNNEWQTSGVGNDLASGVPAVRNWTHVTATYTGNTLSIYLNGQWMAQREVALSTTGNSLVIGAEIGSFAIPFDGKIDDLRVYDRGLSAGEVTELYDSEKPQIYEQIGQDILGEVSPSGQGDYSGQSVSISADGRRVALGAQYGSVNGRVSGTVRIFELSGESWIQVGQTIPGKEEGDNAGYELSLSSDGTRVAVGSPRHGDNNEGQVRVFELTGGEWVQVGEDINGILADGNLDDVSMNHDGSLLVIGRSDATPNGFRSGQVQVYAFNGADWAQLGQNLNGEAPDSFFGASVSIAPSSNRIAVGAPTYVGNRDSYVQIFELSGNSWNQIGQTIVEEEDNLELGHDIAMNNDGTRIAVGAPNWNIGGGYVRIYELLEDSWVQIGRDIDGDLVDRGYGDSVSMNAKGDLVAIGSGESERNGNEDDYHGIVQIFQLADDDWTPIGETLVGAPYSSFGRSVAMDAGGDTVAVGAPYHYNADDVEAGLARIYRMPQQATPVITRTHTVTQATIDPEADTDGDGVLDVAETGSGAFVDATDTGTNPRLADSDGDGVKDGVELADQTDPNDSESYNFVNSGLVAYYPFNGNANDESGNGNDGVVNGATPTLDRNNDGDSAYDFDSPNSNIEVRLPAAGLGLTPAEDYTISVWFSYDSYSSNYNHIFSTRGECGSFAHELSTAQGQGGPFVMVSGVTCVGGPNITIGRPSTGQWHMGTLSFSDRQTRFYLNGVLVGEAPPFSGAAGQASALVFGGWENSTDMDGQLDDIRIYNRALSEQEVSDLYELERPPIVTLEVQIADTESGSVTGAGIYDNGTEAVIEATPSPGYLFTGWGGDASGIGNPLALVMDRDFTVEALFEQDLGDTDGDGLTNYEEVAVQGTDPDNSDTDGDGFSDGLEVTEGTSPLAIVNFPTRNVTVIPPETGAVSGAGIYGLNRPAIMLATPSPGYQFVEWAGDDGAGSDNPLLLLVDRDLRLEVVFGEDNRDSDEDGLTNYQEIVVEGTDPDNPDSDGDGFSDGQEVAEGTDPGAGESVPTRQLVLNQSEDGSISGAGIYPLGGSVTLEAVAELGYLFLNWTGDASGDNNPLSLVMVANQTVGALFTPDLRDSDEDGLTNYDEIVVYETDPSNPDSDADGFNDGIEVDADTLPGDAASFPSGRLVNVTFNEEFTVAFLQVEGLAVGQLYHVIGSVDGASFFKFFDSDFTANSSEMIIDQPVDVGFRQGLLLRLEAGSSRLTP